MKRAKTKDKRTCNSGQSIGRRLFMVGAGVVATLPLFRRKSAATPSSSSGDEIRQPDTRDDKSFMDRAFEMKRLATGYGDQPYGAIVVRDGKIIGQSWSRVILDQDPTAHAEISAIRDAASRQKSRDLSGAVLYSSSRACPMCEAAAYWAGIGRMVHGHSATDAGRPQLCG